MNDLHSKWHHRWVNSKTRSFNSSIHRLGVCAIDDISKGETILVAGGIVVPKTDIKTYRKMMGHLGYQIDENFFICPTTIKELKETGVINHSCSPNSGFLDSPIKVVAIKAIPRGNEITLDYAFCESYFEPFKCNCSSKNCRKLITQNDWKKKPIQQKYRKYFSPYLKAKLTSKD